MKRDYSDVVIVGGGASGLAAAVGLGLDPGGLGLSVTLIEKNPQPGRKLRATGSGRCNITNRSAVGYKQILSFFRLIGLVTREYENGLVYPYSESAADVVSLLISRAKSLGTEFITGAEVTEIETIKEGRTNSFDVTYCIAKDQGRTEKRKLRAGFVILATGGKAGPSYGTTGDGYRLARSLGHSIVTPVPALTPVECREWGNGAWPSAVSLAGTRSRGKVTLYRKTNNGARKIFEEEGEIQFTRSGLSGICVFNMTRHMRYDREAGESIDDYIIMTDLFPDHSFKSYLAEQARLPFHSEKTEHVLTTILKENIARYVIERASVAAGDSRLGDKPLTALTDSDIDFLDRTVHNMTFRPVNLRGWKDAQVTSGGVSLDEIDDANCMSLITDNLYITGELADKDFECGGFNLSNAWVTGLAAAAHIVSQKSEK